MKDRGGFLGGDALLFLTSIIWGFAFVAQRVGMESLGPFAFNGVRYLIGAVSLLPLLFLLPGKPAGTSHDAEPSAFTGHVAKKGGTFARVYLPPLLAGGAMFFGSSFQQVGIVTTTAGNAAFITSLYVVIVPFLGSIFGKKVAGIDWMASLVAVGGLWLITMTHGLSMSGGDFLVLVCAFFWALHIIVIGRFASTYDPIRLAMGQFAIAGLLSLVVSLFTEKTDIAGIRSALLPLLYGGVCSCGVAFTLQIFGQRRAKASHASIILALEGLFGAVGGILLLGEPATIRLLAGGALMILATMLPQLWTLLRGLLRPLAVP
jgi:drug/metabolite transporter (DMT)-like permease